MDFAKRAGRNEEISREANRRIEERADDGSPEPIDFHCECAQITCWETIELPAATYDEIHSHPFRFVVAPGHAQVSVEQVVDEHPGYVVVEKVGEAREQIERDHPHQRHRQPPGDGD